jgi:AbrB family looped-hinge helix DNA binding protein
MSKEEYHLTGKSEKGKVAEAAVEYLVSGKDKPPVSTISTKNQITLPAHLLREMGLKPGDRLAVTREGNRLVLRARPRDWVEYHAGGLRDLYGATAGEQNAYVRELRTERDRDRTVEEAWSGRKPPSQP